MNAQVTCQWSALQPLIYAKDVLLALLSAILWPIFSWWKTPHIADLKMTVRLMSDVLTLTRHCLTSWTKASPLQVLKEMKFPKEQGINVLVIQKTFTDQGSVSQQLFKVHELNPLICSLNQTKFFQVTRGSLADKKHLPALTVLSSESLDKAFFFTFSLCNICPKTFLRKFLAGFQLLWKAVLTTLQHWLLQT